jgi:hypothetical protein
VKSEQIPRTESPAKGGQIQQPISDQQYPGSDLRLEATGWGRHRNKLSFHANNTCLHSAKVITESIVLNFMKQVSHPPDSPNLAPLESVIFGHIERKLSGYDAESLSEFLIRIRAILSEIPPETLNTRFLGEIERLQRFIDSNEEHVE